MHTYEYSISGHSKNGALSGNRLLSELRALTFFDQLVHMQVESGDLRLSFSRKLTTAEKKKVDGVIAAHDGTLPDAFDEREGGRVADLPPGLHEGQRTFAIDGRKTGDGTGNGTGVPVYWSRGAWRRYSDDEPVSE